MTAFRRAWARVVSFFRKQDLDAGLEQELAIHIELATEDHLRQGMALPEARRLAYLKLGGMEHSRDLHRKSRGLPWLDGITQDIRYAFRAMRRSPGFTLTAVATLAVGIGVNAAVFTVTKAALFAGFPLVERNDRILYLTSRVHGCCVSYPDFQDWREQAKSFQGIAAVAGIGVVLSDQGGFAESHDATQVSSNTFHLIGIRPLMGRDFTPADEMHGAAPVAILSYGFWERRYGMDPAAVGRTVRINGVPTMVIGVMPAGFSFPQKQDLWVPLIPDKAVHQRQARNLWFAFGRLEDGASIERARAEMETIGHRLEKVYPASNQGQLPVVDSFNGFFIGPNETILYSSMWGAVGFVLLIACANLANLMLARAIGRFREISVRVALGASRWRIVRQLLVESVILSGAGGITGWWIAKWSVRAYSLADRGPGRSSWRILDYSLDYHVLWYLVAISIATALLFGLAPALRLSKLDANAIMKDGGRGSTSGSRGRRLSAVLVAGEIALAMVLLAGAGVMIRSFLKIYTASPGVQTEKILTAEFSLPTNKYPNGETRLSYYERLKSRVEAIPGVESMAIASALPTFRSLKIPYEFPGSPTVDEKLRPKLSAMTVSPSYFQTVGAKIVAGRDFTSTDETSGPPTTIVNRQFAAKFWPGEDPVGKRLRLFAANMPAEWMTVVGVASDIIQNDAKMQTFDPLIYLPFRQTTTGVNMIVMVRTQVPPASLATVLRREIYALDSDLPIFGPFPLATRLEGSYWSNGLYGTLFLIFAAIALLLASVGLYAVIAHSVNQRTQEIGIRVAMGATSRDIFRLIVQQGMLPLGIGLAIGLSASLAVTPVLKSMLVLVSPADPVSLTVASGMLIVSATLGCLIPARRAIRVDPVIALRHD